MLTLLTFSVLGVLALAGCIPPAGMVSDRNCMVLQTLEQPLPAQARMRVRVVGPADQTSFSLSDSVSARASAEALAATAPFHELQTALVEALATSEGLLLDVVGWQELCAYRAHLENMRRDQTRSDWEFGAVDSGRGERIDLTSLVEPELWASCPYEAVAEVLEYELVSAPYVNPLSEYYGTMLSHRATVHVHLVERAGGKTLMAVSILVDGSQIFEKAARSFARELERQFWEAREGKPRRAGRL